MCIGNELRISSKCQKPVVITARGTRLGSRPDYWGKVSVDILGGNDLFLRLYI